MTRRKITIVGAGLAGSVLARKIADDYDFDVDIVEKRDHIGGNCFDYIDEYGLLSHKYGPHYFRADSDDVFQFLSRFTEWIEGKYFVKSYVDGKLYQFPVNLNTMEQILGGEVDEERFKEYLKEQTVHYDKISNAEEQCLAIVGRQLYEMFFKGYTEKQWGCKANDLAPDVTARIPFRFNRNDLYVVKKHVVMPKDGYTEMFSSIMDKSNINVTLNEDYLKNKTEQDLLIYTGKVDEYLDCCHGRLKYRSIKIERDHYPDCDYKQPCVQVNYPNEREYCRTLEYKHITGQKHKDTVQERHYALDKGDPFYPVLDHENVERAKQYRDETQKLKNEGIFFIGRLAEFRYYDMDHVVERALKMYDEEIKPYIERNVS